MVRPARTADRRGARAAHGGRILPEVRDRSRLDRSAGPLPVGDRSRRRGGGVGGSPHPRRLAPLRRGDDRRGRRTRLPRPVGRRRTVRVARTSHRRAPPRRVHGRRDPARIATRDRGTRDLGAGRRVHGPDPALAARAQPRSLPRLSRGDRPWHRPARVYDDLAAHFQPGARGLFPAGCGRRGDGAVQRARLLVPRGGRAAHAARHQAARLARGASGDVAARMGPALRRARRCAQRARRAALARRRGAGRHRGPPVVAAARAESARGPVGSGAVRREPLRVTRPGVDGRSGAARPGAGAPARAARGTVPRGRVGPSRGSAPGHGVRARRLGGGHAGEPAHGRHRLDSARSRRARGRATGRPAGRAARSARLALLGFPYLFGVALWDRPSVAAPFTDPWALALYGYLAGTALAARRWGAGQMDSSTARWTARGGELLWVLCGAAVFAGGSVELQRYFGRRAPLAGDLALSVFWLAYAGALVRLGFQLDRKDVRSAGLAVAAGAGLKIVLYDLSNLDALYSIASFFALALIALAVAYAYNRKAASSNSV